MKYKATEQYGLIEEFEEMPNGGLRQFELYDNIAEFIQTFEENKKKKKEAKKGIEKFI